VFFGLFFIANFDRIKIVNLVSDFTYFTRFFLFLSFIVFERTWTYVVPLCIVVEISPKILGDGKNAV